VYVLPTKVSHNTPPVVGQNIPLQENSQEDEK
jgi:hypothetical protein